MANYRVYNTTVQGQKIAGPAMVVTAAREHEVLTAAIGLTTCERGAEVWLQDRLVCRVPPATRARPEATERSPAGS